jgi:hypothetical protein
MALRAKPVSRAISARAAAPILSRLVRTRPGLWSRTSLPFRCAHNPFAMAANQPFGTDRP